MCQVLPDFFSLRQSVTDLKKIAYVAASPIST